MLCLRANLGILKSSRRNRSVVINALYAPEAFMKTLASKLVATLFFFACLLPGVAEAQAEAFKALIGKTLTVQGQSVSSVMVTFNADGTFIQCTPGFSCEVLGQYKVSADGKVSMVYKNLFFDRQTLVRRTEVREGVVDEKTFLGRSVLKIEETPMVSLANEGMKEQLIGKLTGVFPDGTQFVFTINPDGSFEECTRGQCDSGTWKIEDKFWVAKHKTWSPPGRYPDGYVRFPLVKIAEGRYQFAGIEVKK
jgi:hypothetical protein